MKRPMLALGLIYVAGILAADAVALTPGPLLTAAFVFGLAALFCSGLARLFLWPAIFLAGATGQTLQTAILSPVDLRTFVGDQPAAVTIRGELLETPSQRIYLHDEQQSIRTVARLRVRQVQRDAHEIDAAGDIVASTDGELGPEFFSGRSVEIAGVIRLPRGPLAPGLFDYRQHLKRQQIHYELRVDSTNSWHISVGTPPMARPIADRFLDWSQHTLALGLPVADESLRLIWAMTLGWKTALTDEVSEPFMKSGTMHVFAISGLHIALISGILVQLLRLFRLPRAWCGTIVIPLIWFYTGASGWQSSAIRSTIMMTVVIAGWSLNRPGDLLNSLFAAGLIILVWDPNQLFQASFQLSFCVVFSLALLLPPFIEWRDHRLRPDPFLPPGLRPHWRYWQDTSIRGFSSALLTSAASWLGSVTLTAIYFHLVTPVSLLANLVIVPLSSGALMCNLGSLICGALLPRASELFNHAGWLFMTGMIRFGHWCIALPGAYFYVPAPPRWLGLLWLATVFPLATGWALAPNRRRWTFPLYGVLFAGVVVWWQNERVEIRLDVLPLGGGHAVYVESANPSDRLLVDCGDGRSVEWITLPFLHARGVNHLDRFLMTHGDVHHMGGATNILQTFDPKTVFEGATRFRSPAYRAIQNDLERRPGRLLRVADGAIIGSWRVLHPASTDRFSLADDNSLVLMGELNGHRILLLGSLGRPGQEALLQRHPGLRADIVVTGLPGRGEALNDDLIDLLRPKLIIMADSEYPATARAKPPIMKRLAHRHIPVIYSRESGCVTLHLRPNQIEVEPLQGESFELNPRRTKSVSATGEF